MDDERSGVNESATRAREAAVMSPNPLRSILSGYGAAALIAVISWAALGVAPLAAALGAWIGGAALTLTLAAQLRRRDKRAATPEIDEVARSLALWESDARLDTQAALDKAAARQRAARDGRA